MFDKQDKKYQQCSSADLYTVEIHYPLFFSVYSIVIYLLVFNL